MKRASPLVSRGNEVDIDSAMTPMIDVVFLLLVFFVWTASFQIVEHVLPSNMAEQLGSQASNSVEPPLPKDIEDVVVKIGFAGASPTWKISGEPFANLAAVEQELTKISRIDNTVTVILAPDSIVPLGNLIETYDVAMVAGFSEISFAVTPQGR